MDLEVEVDTGEEKKAEAIAHALAADAKPKRGTASFRASGGKVLINIQGGDEAAVRASANSSLRLLDACLSIMR